jgi:ribosomal protein S18 acetylase RimI-like enzyme
MREELLVRRARPEDGAALLSMLGKLAEHEGAAEPPCFGEAELARDVFGLQPRLHIGVAVDADDVPIGLISAFENYSSWEGKAGLQICDLWVEMRARERGIGLALVEQMRAWFPNRRIDAYVVRTNAARGFYERYGFVHESGWCLYRLPST